MSNRTNKAVKGTLASFFQYGLHIVLQISLAPLVLKVAGQETLGAYSIFMQIIGYSILLDLGFSVALSRYLSQAYGFADNNNRFNDLLSIGRTFFLFSNGLLALAIVLVSFWIGDFISASPATILQARVALCITAVWTILRTPLAIYSHGLFATQNMAILNIIASLGNLCRLCMSLILVYFGGGLLGLVGAYILAELLTYTLHRRFYRKAYSHYPSGWKIQNKALFKEVFHFGIQYMGVNVAVMLFLGSDSIIVGNLYGASAVSVYYVTKIPAFMAFQFIYKITDNAGPALNELFAQKKHEALQNAYLKLLRYSMFLALPLSIGIVGFNKELVTVWVGASQYAGDIMSLALAVFTISEVSAHLHGSITLASGNMRWWVPLSIVLSVICICLSFFLGKRYGMQWVMVSIAMMNILSSIFLFRRSIQELKISFVQVWTDALMPSIMVSLPISILVILFKQIKADASLFNLITEMSMILVLWIFCIFIMGLSRSEKEYWKNKWLITFRGTL